MSITDGETLRLERIIQTLQAKSECDDALLIAMSEKCEKLNERLGLEQIARSNLDHELEIAKESLESALESAINFEGRAYKAEAELTAERDVVKKKVEQLEIAEAERDALKAEVGEGKTYYLAYIEGCNDSFNTIMGERNAAIVDAKRYRFLFAGNKVYSQFTRAHGGWDGSGGKDGFDAAIDRAMEAEHDQH